jgi:hypothetical protein
MDFQAALEVELLAGKPAVVAVVQDLQENLH